MRGRPSDDPITIREREFCWHLHSTFAMYIIRKHALNHRRLPELNDEYFQTIARSFLAEFQMNAAPAGSGAALDGQAPKS